MSRADAPAWESTCTRTRLKSCPKRGSIRARAARLEVGQGLARLRGRWVGLLFGLKRSSRRVSILTDRVRVPAPPGTCRNCRRRHTCAALRVRRRTRRILHPEFSGMRVTCSATRSASCSYGSPGVLIASFVCIVTNASGCMGIRLKSCPKVNCAWTGAGWLRLINPLATMPDRARLRATRSRG